MSKKIDQKKLISLIFATSRLMRMSQSKKPGISMLQLETLRFISENQPTMKDIADYLTITPPSATSLVGALVKSRMIRRLPSKKDRRIIRLIITPAGEKVLITGLRAKAGSLSKIIARLSIKDQKSLIKILKNMSMLTK